LALLGAQHRLGLPLDGPLEALGALVGVVIGDDQQGVDDAGIQPSRVRMMLMSA
jgi:hypothetical protein